MSNGSKSPIGLDQLLALNEEIAALVRAGVPLELGLRQISESTTGGLSRLSSRLSERMSAGASVREALDEEGDHLPGVYRAVVEAGLRSGRLPEALEALTDMARSLHELQRRVTVALIYPLLVVILTWGLLIGFVRGIVPRFQDLWADLRLRPGMALDFLNLLADSFEYIIIVPPCLLLGFWLCLLFYSSTRGAPWTGRLMSGRLHRYAWYPGIVNNFDRAIFLKTLTLLIRNQTSLHESLLLAGFASGNRSIVAGATRVAEQLEAGESLQTSIQQADELPQFLRWMLTSGEKHGRLEETLTLAGDVYFSRANRQADILSTVLPSVLTIFIAGGVTLLYALALFAPVFALYSELGQPIV
jgi:general secretion pathway protein F